MSTEEGDLRAWRHAMSQMGPILSEEEASKITTVAIATAPETSVEELAILLNWAEEVRMNDAILTNVLEGAFTIQARNGEPVFALTAAGCEQVRTLAERHGLPMPDEGASDDRL